MQLKMLPAFYRSGPPSEAHKVVTEQSAVGPVYLCFNEPVLQYGRCQMLWEIFSLCWLTLYNLYYHVIASPVLLGHYDSCRCDKSFACGVPECWYGGEMFRTNWLCPVLKRPVTSSITTLAPRQQVSPSFFVFFSSLTLNMSIFLLSYSFYPFRLSGHFTKCLRLSGRTEVRQ